MRLVLPKYDPHELKAIIGLCDFFVGSRMHACIAALSQGIPCVGIAYSRKFEGVFSSVGVGDWVIDGRVTGNPEALTRALALYRQRNDVRSELVRRADRATVELRALFRHLLGAA